MKTTPSPMWIGLKCEYGHELKLVKSAQHIDGYVWRCRSKHAMPRKQKSGTCNIDVSLMKNTFFEESNLRIMKLLAFSYLWMRNVSQDIIMTELSIARYTAVDWRNFCRKVAYDGMVVRKKNIGGLGKEVEIDESKFGRRKYHRGHAVEGQWVFGGEERGRNACFLVAVEPRDKNNLLDIIKDWILLDTTIISNFWKAYDCSAEKGYNHFKDPESEQHTNLIEGLWRHVKCSMLLYHRSK